jgi:hypothetical protein
MVLPYPIHFSDTVCGTVKISLLGFDSFPKCWTTSPIFTNLSAAIPEMYQPQNNSNPTLRGKLYLIMQITPLS